jgi:very-short-patch-repair endonuclease
VDSAWARNRRTTAPAFRELTLKKRARLTRRSPTESEAALARLIKGRRLDVSFERLVPLFRYVVDLCACVLVCLCACVLVCAGGECVIEVDGGYRSWRGAF